MGTEIVAALTGLFCTLLSSIATFFLTKRKYNAEVDSQQIKNMSDAFDIYKKTMEESLESQKRTMEETINLQNKKIDALQEENDTLKAQVRELQKQLTSFLMESSTRPRKRATKK